MIIPRSGVEGKKILVCWCVLLLTGWMMKLWWYIIRGLGCWLKVCLYWRGSVRQICSGGSTSCRWSVKCWTCTKVDTWRFGRFVQLKNISLTHLKSSTDLRAILLSLIQLRSNNLTCLPLEFWLFCWRRQLLSENRLLIHHALQGSL